MQSSSSYGGGGTMVDSPPPPPPPAMPAPSASYQGPSASPPSNDMNGHHGNGNGNASANGSRTASPPYGKENGTIMAKNFNNGMTTSQSTGSMQQQVSQPPPSALKLPRASSQPLSNTHSRASSFGPADQLASSSQQQQQHHQHSNSQSSFSSQILLPTPRSRLSRPMSSSRRSSMCSLDSNGYESYNNRMSTASPSINELASQFASASMFDLSQSYITPHLGSNANNLMPRIKTIEMYRKNAKKSNDPVIQFQFAQYMLQTALLSGTTNNPNSKSSASSVSSGSTNQYSSEMPRESSANSLSLENNTNNNNTTTTNNNNNTAGNRKSKHMSTMSTSSASNGNSKMTAEEEKRVKHDLLKEAISNLRKLSDKGFADAQYLLGDAYASGALGKADLKESFTLFHLAAKHGHGEASYRAALCLEEGWGTSKDVRRAVQFLRNAASRNQPGAMLRLGLACFYGRLGLPSTLSVKQEGIKWLTRSAEAANEVFPQAPFELAKVYEAGYRDIVIRDDTFAVQLYVKSAELNYIPAAAKLGHAYEYGQLSCPQDAALSIHYYTIAAMGGDPGSMLAMCAWYMVGAEPVLPRNEEEAFEWAHRGAERGLAKAQFAVGYFMENGIGTTRDILQSSNWYHKAAAGGDERAVERIKKNREMAANGKKQAKSKKGDKDCIVM